MTNKENFVKEFSRIYECKIDKLTESLYQTSGKLNCLLYIKISNTRPSWGFTKNVIDELKSKNWFLVLLSPSSNYFLPADYIADYVKKRNTHKGDYKINASKSHNKYEFTIMEELLIDGGLYSDNSDIKPIKKVKYNRGTGGESEYHLNFKNFIAKNPTRIGLPANIEIVRIEYTLPSLDTIDVVFINGNQIIGIEVKSKISSSDDIERGLYQCIKYKSLLEAKQKVNGEQSDSRVILALEGQFPEELKRIKDILSIEVIDEINIT